MGHGPRYRVPLRRRKQKRTDYRMRKTMVLSDAVRLVVRPTLRNMMVQIIEADSMGDKVLAAANSEDLKKFAWTAPSGNIPAAYLTGYLLGKRAKAAGVNEAVLDAGLIRPVAGARVFATLKGAVDSGLSVPFGEGIFPSDERIRGEHIAKYSRELFERDPELYSKRFSQYLSERLKPEEIMTQWTRAKESLDAYYQEGT